MWLVEMSVAGQSVAAGSDGCVAWRRTPWLGAEAARGGSRPLRRALQLCSLDKQRSLAVNKTGAYVSVLEGVVVTTAVENKHFFRKGILGDWRNHMTPEMAARLDGIVEEALKGSGFNFGCTNTSN
ncbi:unnamed protein product [Miscanthus lutarioriparius]|nr:unnamed protein product [Miscanthus lutarioriparius]